MIELVRVVVCLSLPLFVLAQYGLYGNYGLNYNYMNPMVNPYAPGISGGQFPVADGPFVVGEQRDCRGLPSMKARSNCRYGNPMIPMNGGMGPYGSPLTGSPLTPGCTDLAPQCAVWASTGQCSTNPLMMRSTCPLSCGTCGSLLNSGSLINSGSIYANPYSNPFASLSGLGGLNAYPISPYMGRSIYETGILRQPNSNPNLRNGVGLMNAQIPKTGVPDAVGINRNSILPSFDF